MKYIVIEAHQSNYPSPITLLKGSKVRIGEKYHGPEGWDNWIFCFSLDHAAEGWVPEQLLVFEDGDGYGIIMEDYTAKELDVEKDEVVEGIKELNGWIWIVRISDGEEGWLPKNKLFCC